MPTLGSPTPPTVSRIMDSPVGPIRLDAAAGALRRLEFVDATVERPSRMIANEILDVAERQLNEYFEGRRRAFDLPVRPEGPDFHLRVWRALRAIPCGETRSYADIARAVGVEQAARAVGQANARNPIAIIVPCHRVITSSGRLGGYAGGLPRKQFLLSLEARMIAEAAAIA